MILMLAGTSDARELALKIQQAGYSLMTTVVTENAAKGMRDMGLPVRVGRLTASEMSKLIEMEGYRLIVDASHPFAEEASRNAMAGAKEAEVPYIRYERANIDPFDHPLITVVEDYAQAADLAAQKGGVVMLTTGSKTLKIFTDRLLGEPEVSLVARMLPRRDNMEKCEELGLEQKNIVAMQGPFSKELNRSLYEHYQVTLMVTKESGKIGSVDEKIEAALEMGIETVVIARPKIEYGTHYSDFESILQELNQTLRGGVSHGFSNGF